MRTVKPQRLGVLHRTYEHGGRCWFTPSVLVAFDFDRPEIPLHEALLWTEVADALGCDQAFDEGMWKHDAEVLVSGSVYPPKPPTTACQVRLLFGPEDAPLIDKRLYAIGDRKWDSLGSSEPETFTEMPVQWTRAFGGPDVADNPHGIALPNIEDPDALIKSTTDKPHPVGLSAFDLMRPLRQQHAGTYDDDWLKHHYPGFPPDIDWRFFNVAPIDQRLEGKLRGGEAFLLENMHPDRPRLEGRVPRLRPRAFITKRGDGTRTLHEVTLAADTLHLLPKVARGVLFYRGAIEIAEDDAADVAELLLALEAPDEPKPIAHYADVLRRRTEGEHAALYAMADEELLPALPDGVDAMGHSDLGVDDVDNSLAAHIQHTLKQRLPENADWEPQAQDAASLVHMLEEAKQKAQLAKERGERKAREQREAAEARAAELGLDLDAMRAKANSDAAGPPKFSADKQLEQLRELFLLSKNANVPLPAVAEQLEDPDLADKLAQMETMKRDNYRKFAHYFPAAARLDGDEAGRLRTTVENARAAGGGLADRDLTGADLSGLDLEGMSFRNAFLENADLTGVRLVGADLRGAVLARADLTGADLSGADLTGANLGRATLHETRLVDCALVDAVLSEASLDGAVVDGAQLDGAMLFNITARQTSFRHTRAKRLLMLNLDLSDVDLEGAELVDSIFHKTTLVGANFNHARIEGSCLAECDASTATFDNLKGANLRVVIGSDLSGASFHAADLTGANLRGIDLTNVCFDEASLGGADISEAILRGSSLQCVRARELLAVRADLRGADLYGADLMGGILQKAKIQGADFTGSNLFRADLAKVIGDENTTLNQANIEQVRFVRRK